MFNAPMQTGASSLSTSGNQRPRNWRLGSPVNTSPRRPGVTEPVDAGTDVVPSIGGLRAKFGVDRSTVLLQDRAGVVLSSQAPQHVDFDVRQRTKAIPNIDVLGKSLGFGDQRQHRGVER